MTKGHDPNPVGAHYTGITTAMKVAMEWAWKQDNSGFVPSDEETTTDAIKKYGRAAFAKDGLKSVMARYDRHLDKVWAPHRDLLKEGVTHPTSYADFTYLAGEAVLEEHNRRTPRQQREARQRIDRDEVSKDMQEAERKARRMHALLASPDYVRKAMETYKTEREKPPAAPERKPPEPQPKDGAPKRVRKMTTKQIAEADSEVVERFDDLQAELGLAAEIEAEKKKPHDRPSPPRGR